MGPRRKAESLEPPEQSPKGSAENVMQESEARSLFAVPLVGSGTGWAVDEHFFCERDARTAKNLSNQAITAW